MERRERTCRDGRSPVEFPRPERLSASALRCAMSPDAAKEAVRIATGTVAIEADLHVPDRAAGLVIFAHGSGSSRFSRRNRAVAALMAAAARPAGVQAVISRGGRPDLADKALPNVQASTLSIVGGYDEPVIHMNRDAMQRMRAPVNLEIVPGATHLFEEPGTLEEVTRPRARLVPASSWWERTCGVEVTTPLRHVDDKRRISSGWQDRTQSDVEQEARDVAASLRDCRESDASARPPNDNRPSVESGTRGHGVSR